MDCLQVDRGRSDLLSSSSAQGQHCALFGQDHPPHTMAAASATLFFYYGSLLHYLRNGRYATAPARGVPAHSIKQARIHLHSIGLVFTLWQTAHYRCPSFSHDLRENLRNVAVPGTGLPLSVWFHYRATALLFFGVVYPFLAFVASLLAVWNQHGGGGRTETQSNLFGRML